MEEHSSKKRKIFSRSMVDSLPRLRFNDYYIRPSVSELAAMEREHPGDLTRVSDFVVGRSGYGYVKFLGETDVRNLVVDRVVKFLRNEIVVYGDGSGVEEEPPVGYGLNKPAEVTLNLKMKFGSRCREKLKKSSERQGAQFISFDPVSADWKFLVPHFSRFGLSLDEEEDISMDDAVEVSEHTMEMEANCALDKELDRDPGLAGEEHLLYHSLPAHLGLDPVKMKEMRMTMFPTEDELELVDDSNGVLDQRTAPRGEDYSRNHLKISRMKVTRESSPTAFTKKPIALLEYNPFGAESGCHDGMLMVHQNKALMCKNVRNEGFELVVKNETPVSGSFSRNAVDAGLFMGRSCGVAWGPNGLLVHAGAPIGSSSSHHTISSIITMEKVAFEKIVRDKSNKVNEKLVDLAFESPLNLHKKLVHKKNEIKFGTFKLQLLKTTLTRLSLAETCRSYISIIEDHLGNSVSNSSRIILMHQVMIWELIKVLFSERERYGYSSSVSEDYEEDMMQEVKETALDVDEEALPLIRRAEFSRWLQESVYHRVQEDVSYLDESSHLNHIFLMLTGRQLDKAVELAASKGDVRLACLLSQAGCSILNRADIGRQLNIWRMNGLDFNFVEKERTQLFQLLAGNIFDPLTEYKIDWKRVMGLLMWFRLPPDMPLSQIFNAYHDLLDKGQVPFPRPVYLDEGAEDETEKIATRHFDLSYYLMLLHSETESDLSFLRTMFSALSSTPDPLDAHMIWHQRAILEAVGVFTSKDLQVLDMTLVAQLLSIGKCHWAIYVIMHMPYCDTHPYLHGIAVREILFQYCEVWNSDESQRQFIENLDIPSDWLHEALAVYFSYYGDNVKALEHFIHCRKWQKAHSIFISSVAHSLFLSENHEEVWRLATSMEDEKSEIENWDLGAGLYISFYLLTRSSQEELDNMIERDSSESRNSACGEFLLQLNDSLKSLENKLAASARVAYTKMSKAICDLMLSDVSEMPRRELQLNCLGTVLDAPLPEDVRSNYFQDAVSLFTCYLAEMAS